jgi:small-conductance mechanosensitive channel
MSDLMSEITQNGEGLVRFFVFLGSAIILGLIIHYISFIVFENLAKRTKTILDDSLVKHSRSPSRLIILLIIVSLALQLLNLSPTVIDLLRHIITLFFIGSVAWLIMKMSSILDDFILSQYRIDVTDNLKARKIRTQLQVFKRILMVVVGITALAAMLMTFEKVRQLGASILASAGIIGIIVGVAAQRTIATFLAGIQIAVTQPIRIDDVVIVENEWGRIEKITLTYVIVRIWDLRRLVLPITYFIEKPFQNWTRVTADILGTVFIYVDYTVPAQAVRDELHRILKSSTLWDGKVCGLQVTNTTEHTVELRALMSAADASKAWDLRCEVREKLVNFIQSNYPDGLPKVRAEIQQTN